VEASGITLVRNQPQAGIQRKGYLIQCDTAAAATNQRKRYQLSREENLSGHTTQ